MDRRRLGNSDIEVSVISLGTWAYGKVARWGVNVDEKEIVETVHRAVDLEINLVDTAPAYGESEEMIGKALRGIREKVYIASKCGANPEDILKQIDNSLKIMKVDYIDLYQVHYPRKEFPIADTIGAMKKIREQGKIRYIGVSNFSVEQLKEAIKVEEIISCQSPYNLLWREIEETGVMEFCRENNIGILTYSSLAQGLLTGKFKDRSDLPTTEGETRTANALFKEGTFEKGLKAVETLREIAQRYDKTPGQVALNWGISQPGISSAIMGARNIGQLEENVKVSDWQLGVDDIVTLSEKGKEVSKFLDYTKNMWGFEYAR